MGPPGAQQLSCNGVQWEPLLWRLHGTACTHAWPGLTLTCQCCTLVHALAIMSIFWSHWQISGAPGAPIQGTPVEKPRQNKQSEPVETRRPLLLLRGYDTAGLAATWPSYQWHWWHLDPLSTSSGWPFSLSLSMLTTTRSGGETASVRLFITTQHLCTQRIVLSCLI